MAINVPPKSGIRVPAEELRQFAGSLFEAAGTNRADAELLSSILVETDLRGIFSHGTRLTSDYVRQMLDGDVNPRPTVRVVQTNPATRIVDGDGGLGHLPCQRAAMWAVQEAKQGGIAGVTTQNHAHIGSAGSFARLALGHDCVGIVISSRRTVLDPEASILTANSSPPISIAVPAGLEPPLVMDMGAPRRWDEALIDRHRQTLLKDLALASVLHAIGAILPGVYGSEFAPSNSDWLSGHGAFIVMVDIAAFIPVVEFKKEMDRFIGEAHNMQPIPGVESAELAGGIEARFEKEYRRNGIPISDGHRQRLHQIATELGVETPFSQFEHTRFDADPPDTGRTLLRRLTGRVRRGGP